MKALLFLLKLAWDCRYRLPLLITVGFMVLDVRMQLDINVQTRRIPRPRRPPPLVNPIIADNDIEIIDVSDTNSTTSSNDSWSTLEEVDISDVELYN